MDNELAIANEKHYWDNAADDPEVDQKYIADVDTQECLDAIIPALNEAVKNGHDDILDVGCGVGRLTIPLAVGQFAGTTIYGIDTSKKMLAIAKSRVPSKLYNVKYKLCDGRTIPYEDNKFAAAYSMLVFQHLDPDAVQGYFSELQRVIRKGGVLRFQYVEGEYHNTFDHNYLEIEMRTWLKVAGFIVDDFHRGLVHPQWNWITAIKL